MPLIEREEAIETLPEMAEFRPIMMEAWGEWMNLPASFRAKMTPSARAFGVHDLMVDLAARRLADSARIIDKAGLKLFLFRDIISVRIKKHDDELVSRNQPTSQVRALLAQECLDGVQAVHHLEMGYVLDRSQTEIVATNLVCPKGRSKAPYWHIELKDEGYQFEVTDLFDNFPIPDSNDQPEATSRWKKRDSSVVIPFKRIVKPNDQP